ncbi:TetR/AcrR family transcriptional regulator [Pseudactinotalea suaedae]|uniref:TetR/AcrR family transcriptional regulator n=1 Tax=Pseudactinotalea suaedae TaxID=1524924 RepID=UPI001391FE2C|nr:TetR family transcriptional regulator [Pseudactinotalea suaedae]
MSTVHAATSRRRGAPPADQRLTRQAVITRAAELIETHGLPAFSLRALAADLDVRPSALYNHVSGLDALLSAVVADAIAHIELTDRPGPWQEWLRHLAVDIRAWLLARPNTAGLILERAGSTQAGPEILNRVTERLSAAGVDRTVAHMAWHTVLTVVVGTVQQDLARRVHTDGTFEAVLDITIDGLVVTAGRPIDPDLRKLVRSHGFSDR